MESFVSQCGEKSFTVSHIFREGDRITCEGSEKRVWCKVDPDDPAKLTPEPLPPELRAALGIA